MPMYHRWRHTIVAVAVVTPLFLLPLQFARSAAPPKAQLPARSVKAIPKAQLPARSAKAIGISTLQPEPLRLTNTAIEPIEWNALNGWKADDHAAAFATFLTSCRPLVRASVREGDKRPMYLALTQVCRQALAVGRLTDDQARIFFEHNFRPLRIASLGDSAGLLTGYYEPIVDGSRFPTGIFKVPIYRRPPDLVPPRNSTGPGFPNKGQSLRRTSSGALVPYYDRGQILDAPLTASILKSVGSRIRRTLLGSRSRDQRAYVWKTAP
jgi:membrane-bound lytic murein transglycosylase